MASSPTEAQKVALRAALRHAVHAPATGAYRRLGGEVDGINCFSSRTLHSLVKKGWLAQKDGRYLISDAGRAVLIES